MPVLRVVDLKKTLINAELQDSLADVLSRSNKAERDRGTLSPSSGSDTGAIDVPH